MDDRTVTARRAGRDARLWRAGPILVAVLAFAYGSVDAAETPEQRRALWIDGEVSRTLTQRDDRRIWAIDRILSEAAKDGSNPDKVATALTASYDEAFGEGRGDATGIIWKTIGGATGLAAGAWAGGLGPPIGALVGVRVAETALWFMDRKKDDRWRSEERDAAALGERGLVRDLHGRFATFLEANPEYRDVAREHAGLVSFPDDSTETILDAAPGLKTLHAVLSINAEAEQNTELLRLLQTSLDEVNSSTQAAFQRVQAEIAVDREQTHFLAQTLLSDQERARAAEDQRIRIAGLQGLSYTISTIISWNNPALGNQVSTVANAAFGVYEAVSTLSTALNNTSGALTGFAMAAFTGNVLGALMPVVNLMIGTGPTVEQQILESVQDLQQQVADMHVAMHERFDQLETYLIVYGDRMDAAFDAVEKKLDTALVRLEDLQRDMQGLKEQNDVLLRSIYRNTAIMEDWLIAMNITPCHTAGEVYDDIEAQEFRACRGRLAALGQGAGLETYQQKPAPVEIEVRHYRDTPDDMVNRGLAAFREITPLEKESLPQAVVGLERWFATADSFDAFLARWPQHIPENDRRAKTGYATSMHAHREGLRRYTKALRRDLYRFASDKEPNAFEGTLLQAGRALHGLKSMLRYWSDLRGERNALRWWQYASEGDWAIDYYTPPKLSVPDDLGLIVDRAMGRDKGRRPSPLVAAIDARILAEKPPVRPRNAQAEQSYVSDVVGVVGKALNREKFEVVRHMMQLGLVEVVLEHRYDYVGGVTFHRRAVPDLHGARFNLERLSPNVRGSNGERIWTVAYQSEHELTAVVRETCVEQDPRKVVFSGHHSKAFNLEMEVEWSSLIYRMKETGPYDRRWREALRMLDSSLFSEDRRKELERLCRRQQRDMYYRERNGVAEAVTSDPASWFDVGRFDAEAEAGIDEWIALNNEIALADAHIRSWLRVALYDSATSLEVVAAVLSGDRGIRSPAEWMAAGEDLYEALRRTDRDLEWLWGALQGPEIKERLRNRFGHAGVMETRYLAIDPMPPDVVGSGEM